jgi:hypothetical protein
MVFVYLHFAWSEWNVYICILGLFYFISSTLYFNFGTFSAKYALMHMYSKCWNTSFMHEQYFFCEFSRISWCSERLFYYCSIFVYLSQWCTRVTFRSNLHRWIRMKWSVASLAPLYTQQILKRVRIEHSTNMAKWERKIADFENYVYIYKIMSASRMAIPYSNVMTHPLYKFTGLKLYESVIFTFCPV